MFFEVFYAFEQLEWWISHFRFTTFSVFICLSYICPTENIFKLQHCQRYNCSKMWKI